MTPVFGRHRMDACPTLVAILAVAAAAPKGQHASVITGDRANCRLGRRIGRASLPPIGIRAGVPDERLLSRNLKVFGDVEVGHHRFLPGEMA